MKLLLMNSAEPKIVLNELLETLGDSGLEKYSIIENQSGNSSGCSICIKAFLGAA